MIVLVILVVSAALIVGAVWGIFGPLPERVEGFLLAMAGGALIVTLMLDMIKPSISQASLVSAMFFVALGAVVFTAVDYLIDEKWEAGRGGGLLVAITLDGIPENLALGVALIGADFSEVAALAGAIFLANLPEAAGGAKQMCRSGLSRRTVFWLWAATAGILASAALVGEWAFAGVAPETIALTRCFAAGAVVASLATEVFPRAFNENHHLSGVAVAVGLILATLLHALSA
ncbi:ZIP family metal transporter [Actibacterium lipolyticum]|uniref:Zinc transporter n=1 Tax=Actibacterium lipolyticum TaxID=1524263 RepID=A0A238KQY5_9RHOB|nr:zinc transporter [Actibacterium lipolyticum]SMX45223.1 hypothetical protein COL8621_02744 [Actibacterium lipolyticum]